MTETLLLGAACNYSSDMLLPFLRSASESLVNVSIVLFSDQRIEVSGVCARSIRPADISLRECIRRLPRGSRLASRISLGIGNTLAAVGLKQATLRNAAFGVAVARYFWYRDWLQRNPVSGPQNVLLADTRDVVFQSDPFVGLGAGRLFCGVEPATLGDCEHNASWFSRCYGELALQRSSGMPVVCSGVIGGERALVLGYLELICDEILRLGSRIVFSSGFDQAIHNHLVWNTDAGGRFQKESWDSPLLTTLHYVNPGSFGFDVDGCLTSPSGSAISIVHQYDRHPELCRWVSNRWNP